MEYQMTNVYRFIEETNGMTIPVQIPLSLFQCVKYFLIASKMEQFGVEDKKINFTIPKNNHFKFKYASLQKMGVLKYYTILMVLALV